MLTGVKGEYANTVALTYDAGGRKATEALTIAGQTYSVGTAYDAAGRESQRRSLWTAAGCERRRSVSPRFASCGSLDTGDSKPSPVSPGARRMTWKGAPATLAPYPT